MARSAVNLSVGRVRVTRAVSPSEAGYIRSMRAQMEVIRANLVRAIDEVDNATPEAIKYAMQPMFDTSQQLVPVDTGKLKRSGFLTVRKTRTGATAAMGYGRYGQPFYAPFVHERLDLRHRAPTQAKFLEDAINQHIGSFRDRVVQYMYLATWVGRA